MRSGLAPFYRLTEGRGLPRSLRVRGQKSVAVKSGVTKAASCLLSQRKGEREREGKHSSCEQIQQWDQSVRRRWNQTWASHHFTLKMVATDPWGPKTDPPSSVSSSWEPGSQGQQPRVLRQNLGRLGTAHSRGSRGWQNLSVQNHC